MKSNHVALAHATSSTEDPRARARVRSSDDGMTVITTVSKGFFKSVFYTRKEALELADAIRSSIASPMTTFAVDWDEKGRGE